MVIGDLLEEEGRRTEAEVSRRYRAMDYPSGIIRETGGECLFVKLDVTSEADWQQAVAATVARFGKLDILVNNAAIYRTEQVEDTFGSP